MASISCAAAVVGAAIGAHLQVLVHRQAEHDLAAFGYQGELPAQPLRRRQRGDVFAVETDASAGRRYQALQRAQQRGLAGAVGAEHGHQFVGGDGQRHSLDRVGAAVTDIEIFDLKQQVGCPWSQPGGCQDRLRAPFVVLHAAGRPLVDEPAEIEHDGSFAQVVHERHVVLDDQ